MNQTMKNGSTEAQCEETTVAFLLCLLDKVALDPKEVNQGIRDLKKGIVNLKFFGGLRQGSPAPYSFSSPADQAKLLSAVLANKTSRKFKAAGVFIKISRNSHKYFRDSKMMKTELLSLKRRLEWPTARDFKKDSEEACDRYLANKCLEANREVELTEKRFNRIDSIRKSGFSGFSNMSAVIEGIRASRLKTGTHAN